MTEPSESLLDIIYQAPLEQAPWRHCLRELKRLLEADGAILMLRRPREWDRGIILLEGLSGLEGELGENLYGDQMFAADPFVNLPVNEVVALADYADMDSLLETEFYQLCLAPFNIFHILGVDLKADDNLGAALRFTRSQSHRPFDPEDRRRLTLLLPHLNRALRIHSRVDHMESERELYAQTVSQFSVATLLLDKNQNLLHSNPVGERILEAADGIRRKGTKLVLERPSDNRSLHQLIEQALAARARKTGISTGAMPIYRPSGKTEYGMIVRPLPVSRLEHEDAAAVAIFISDPEQPMDIRQQAALSQLFGFTPAESRLALQLANGLSLDDACLALHISRNTGRAHLRSIFSKSGASQQSQLVRLILNSVANLGGSAQP